MKQTSLYSINTLLRGLPSELTKHYTIQNLIYINRHNAIFSMINKESKQKYILKLLDKTYYNEFLFNKLNNLNHSSFLLPVDNISGHAYQYMIYPQFITLTEAVSTKVLTYPILRTLIADIGNAIITLHSHSILHLDITPHNIFQDNSGHFYLGDFSSSIYVRKNLLIRQSSLRTGTTHSFAPRESIATPSFWTDCYSFTLLLYTLFNYGIFPANIDEPIHSPFAILSPLLHKMLNQQPRSHHNMLKSFLSELEEILSLCDKDPDCQNYTVQIQTDTTNPFFDTTLDCQIENPPKRNMPQLPLYGMLLLCSILFLFSLCHFLYQKDSTSKYNSTTIPAITANPFSENLQTTTMPVHSSIPHKRISDSKMQTLLDISGKTYCSSLLPKKKVYRASIQVLLANHCRLSSCQMFSNFTGLKELYLSHNTLTSTKKLISLQQLNILVLSKNKLTDVSPLTKLPALTTLDLSHNHTLKNLSSLATLHNLQTLVLTNTNVSRKEIKFLQKELPHCIIFY